MKRISICICLFVIIILLAGCGGEELENKNFVLALGLDVEDDNLRVIYSFPDLSKLTKQDKAESGGIFATQCHELWEGEDIYQKKSAKRLDFAHLKCIVMSRAFMESEYYYDCIMRNLEEGTFADNIPVVVTDEDMEKILDNENVEGGSIGDFLEKLITNYGEIENKKIVTLNSLIKKIYSNSEEPTVLKLSFQNGLYSLSE